jgi:putative FmdB family regulatory protein
MYEFYCADCNTIYTFFSKIINTAKTPGCPKCQNGELSRQISRFAFTGKSNDENNDATIPDLNIDPHKMEMAMASLASQAENINDEDPRGAADLLRKLSTMTGLKLGDKMEEALSRMEAGEDPEAIEQQMGDINEDELFKTENTSKNKSKKAPLRDETLYDM